MLKQNRAPGLTLRLLCIPLIIITLASGSIASDATYQVAIDTASHWINLVDNGKYEESYNQSSAYFRSVFLEKDWKRTIETFRGPLGKVISRQLISSQYTTSLPGAPDGQYVIIQFNTSFEKKKAAIETITPMRDEDGLWWVSGYNVR